MKSNINPKDLQDFKEVVFDLLDSSSAKINNDLPSVWIEQNFVMGTDLSGKPGKFRYSNSPHVKEVVDHLSQVSPVKEIIIMKSAQSALTKGALLPGIAWLIANDPGPAKLLVGHNTLLASAGIDLDLVIDGCDIRDSIKSSSKRSRDTKSGDTNLMKEFSGGSIALGLTNPDSLRQISLRYLFVDDYDAMVKHTKKDGDIDTIIKQRQNSFAHNRKLFKISTPTRKGKSNIEEDYLKGDQRKWNIPCPCCNEFIVLEWAPKMVDDETQNAGIVWAVDDDGHLIPETVGYKCQNCGDIFDDSDKTSWLNAGKWIPTAKSSRPDLVSYHFNALSSPTFMFGWEHYIYEWIDILNAETDVKREQKKQSFYNLVLGEPYTPKKKSTNASKLQSNIRRYDIGTIPERLSISDGNGPIVMVTCAMDLNGTIKGYKKGKRDDARIDWEVKAWAAGGQSYSIDQGSFGSFINRDPNPEARTNMKSYKAGVTDSVWKEVQELIDTKYENDETGKMMPIFITGIDTGEFTDYAYNFIKEGTNEKRCVALKGKDDEETLIRDADDYITYDKGKSVSNLFMVRTNYTKDIVSDHMDHTIDKAADSQPFGFMNFPIPRDGKYLKTTFFDHYESEHKIEVKNRFKWEPKTGSVQNHFWDVAVYNEVVKDIFYRRLLERAKVKHPDWNKYVNIIMKTRK
jgi:phage terminase large subunit GpA-like protein